MTDQNSDSGGYLRGHGNPITARVSLGKAFLATIADDFVRHGKEAIELLRKERPHDYVKLVAALLPKEFPSAQATLEDMPDDEFDRVFNAVRSLVAAADAADDDAGIGASKETDGS
jgi:hypothetical protein